MKSAQPFSQHHFIKVEQTMSGIANKVKDAFSPKSKSIPSLRQSSVPADRSRFGPQRTARAPKPRAGTNPGTAPPEATSTARPRTAAKTPSARPTRASSTRTPRRRTRRSGLRREGASTLLARRAIRSTRAFRAEAKAREGTRPITPERTSRRPEAEAPARGPFAPPLPVAGS